MRQLTPGRENGYTKIIRHAGRPHAELTVLYVLHSCKYGLFLPMSSGGDKVDETSPSESVRSGSDARSMDEVRSAEALAKWGGLTWRGVEVWGKEL